MRMDTAAARRWLVNGLAAGLLVLMGVSAWLVAPAPTEPMISPRTALSLARAPFARRIIIGDSRVHAAGLGAVLVTGYPGSTIGQMDRLTRTLCAISDAEIVFALGTNDAKTTMPIAGPEASLAQLGRMVDACGADRVLVAEIWPGEHDKAPAGAEFDAALIAQLNSGIRAMTAAGRGQLIEAPRIAGHTVDGIHFTAPVAERYLDTLMAAPLRVEARSRRAAVRGSQSPHTS
jgi:hypothetical protein